MDRVDGQSGAVFWFAFPYRPDFTTSPASPYSELASEVSRVEHCSWMIDHSVTTNMTGILYFRIIL